MASLEPTEDDILKVIDFIGLNPVDDRSMVAQALKNNNLIVENVVMQFFDNPESFKQKYQSTWDESMFEADRDGSQNTAGIGSNYTATPQLFEADHAAFHIDTPGPSSIIQGVTPNPDPFGAGAPSRPPSRSNSPSPMGRTLEWTASSATGMSTSQAQEDEDMQRALRESAQEAGITYADESVAINTTLPATTFGPANRTDYDQGNWALVPFGASKTRVVTSPRPSARKRAPGAPSFLIQGGNSPYTHQAAGLLTIFHEIPLARNILLDVGSPAPMYGHHGEWFAGQEIVAPQVPTQVNNEESQWEGESQDNFDFENELHRLMAFLDSSDRSYATVGPLVDYIQSADLSPEKPLLERLAERYPEKVKPLTSHAGVTLLLEEGFMTDGVKFGMLDIELSQKDYTPIKTLYEAVDRILWSDVYTWVEVHDASKMAVFQDMGEVFMIKFGNTGPKDSIEIPETFYPERYLLDRKNEACQIQRAWCETQRDLERIQTETRRINDWRDEWSRQILDKNEVLNKIKAQWAEYSAYLEGRARFQAMEESGFDTDLYPDYHAAPCKLDSELQGRLDKTKDILEFCASLIAEWNQRAKGFSDELELLDRRRRFLGRLLTVPDKPGRRNPMVCNKYFLRGVASSKDVVYVCQKAEADLIDLGEEHSTLSDQWWRLAYDIEQTEQPVTAEKLEFAQMLERLWKETKTPLLVYATQHAIDTPRSPLTSALERFVKADNKAFHKEESAEKTGDSPTEKRATFVDPLSPSKRKHRSDSPDSMDSNRASLGSEDRNGFGNPFSDQREQEMVDFTGREVDIARSASIESVTEVPPPLPSRNAPLVEISTDTLPSTSSVNGWLEGEGKLVDTGDTPHAGDEASEPKLPEMQERARPPPFMTQSTDGVKHSIEMVDMDMHDD